MGVFVHNRTTARLRDRRRRAPPLFAALTVSLVFVDRQPIAGDGSLVGLATFNLDARAILGQNDLMEKLSNALLIVPAVGALMPLTIVGCKQLIRSRSRGGVDRDLWLLLGTYAAMLVLYVLFNCISPNNRPILEDGVCEPSFPSSHTLLAVTMCGAHAQSGRATHPRGGPSHRSPGHLRRGHGGHRRRTRHGGRSLGHRHPWRHPARRGPGCRLPHDSVHDYGKASRGKHAQGAGRQTGATIRQPPFRPHRTSSRNLPFCESLPWLGTQEIGAGLDMVTRPFHAGCQHLRQRRT